MKTKKVNLIELSDWNDLVEKTYGKPYSLQQQDGCMPNGSSVYLSVPGDAEDYYKDKIEEVVNGEDMGVSFKAWLARDHKQKLSDPLQKYGWSVRLWWERNFYPNVQTIANDLFERGLIKRGEYVISISW